MKPGVRRIVTGHDSKGNAVVRIDDVIDFEEVGGGVARFAKPWTTDRFPADNNDDFDGSRRETRLTCPGGSVLRFVDIAPQTSSPMHRTVSLDYGIVLEGEIVLELDDKQQVSLQAGDVVVQRGTIHAWINNSDCWTRIVFVLLDAEPVRIGDETLAAVNG